MGNCYPKTPKAPLVFHKGDVVSDLYEVVGFKGRGGSAHVYDVIDRSTGKHYALKVSRKEINNRVKSAFDNECEILSKLGDADGFPAVRDIFMIKEQYALVIDLKGEDLYKIRKRLGVFGAPRAAYVGAQILACLKTLHGIGIVHRDIKPGNIVQDEEDDMHYDGTMYLIDMGLCIPYTDLKGNHLPYHVPARPPKHCAGTGRYCSLNQHAGISLSRRDDLETLAYVLAALATDQLPWSHIKAKSARGMANIQGLKASTSPEAICEGLPAVFAEFMAYARDMNYMEQPKYNKWIKRFMIIYEAAAAASQRNLTDVDKQ